MFEDEKQLGRFEDYQAELDCFAEVLRDDLAIDVDESSNWKIRKLFFWDFSYVAKPFPTCCVCKSNCNQWFPVIGLIAIREEIAGESFPRCVFDFA